MTVKVLKRNIFQRIFGIPATRPPADESCWQVGSGQVEIDLGKAPELKEKAGGLRLEGKGLDVGVLVIRGEDGRIHAFRNKCTHGGRRLDPVPGAKEVQCCSIGKSTFNYQGQCERGSAREAIVIYPVREENGRVVVEVGVG